MFTHLNQPTHDLHAEVERIYGRPIKLGIETHDPVFGGYSNILDDGTPFIILNDAGFDVPCTLVHELFHLKHRAEGEPSIYRLVGKNVDQQRADEAFLVLEEVREFVAHARFFGSWKKWAMSHDAKSMNTCEDYWTLVPAKKSAIHCSRCWLLPEYFSKQGIVH